MLVLEVKIDFIIHDIAGIKHIRGLHALDNNIKSRYPCLKAYINLHIWNFNLYNNILKRTEQCLTMCHL